MTAENMKYPYLGRANARRTTRLRTLSYSPNYPDKWYPFYGNWLEIGYEGTI